MNVHIGNVPSADAQPVFVILDSWFLVESLSANVLWLQEHVIDVRAAFPNSVQFQHTGAGHELDCGLRPLPIFPVFGGIKMNEFTVNAVRLAELVEFRDGKVHGNVAVFGEAFHRSLDGLSKGVMHFQHVQATAFHVDHKASVGKIRQLELYKHIRVGDVCGKSMLLSLARLFDDARGRVQVTILRLDVDTTTTIQVRLCNRKRVAEFITLFWCCPYSAGGIFDCRSEIKTEQATFTVTSTFRKEAYFTEVMAAVLFFA